MAKLKCRPAAVVFLNEHRERNQTSTEHHLIGSQRKLVHLRRDTDSWMSNGAVGMPPQPAAYQLKLGILLATEIWRGPT